MCQLRIHILFPFSTIFSILLLSACMDIAVCKLDYATNVNCQPFSDHTSCLARSKEYILSFSTFAIRAGKKGFISSIVKSLISLSDFGCSISITCIFMKNDTNISIEIDHWLKWMGKLNITQYNERKLVAINKTKMMDLFIGFMLFSFVNI